MFDKKTLSKIEPTYFNIIIADKCDVTIQSKNTGHYWYLHNSEYPTDGFCIIYHKHKYKNPYHEHGKAETLEKAIESIKEHDTALMIRRERIE